MLVIKVTPDKGKAYEVNTSTRDVLKWERGGKGRSLASLEENLRMTDIYALAHVASNRTEQFTGSLESFEETCELEVIGADEEPDPTQKAR